VLLLRCTVHGSAVVTAPAGAQAAASPLEPQGPGLVGDGRVGTMGKRPAPHPSCVIRWRSTPAFALPFISQGEALPGHAQA
jgi:hypothetical protein